MAYCPHITDATQFFTDEEIIGLLPKNFIFIAKLIGISKALNLIENYGGTSIFVPNQRALAIHNDIAIVIGLSSFKKLSAQFGGSHIEIPLGTPIITAMRHRMIRELAKKESKPKIARKFGLTMRTIRSIINTPEKLKKIHIETNLDLFDSNNST